MTSNWTDDTSTHGVGLLATACTTTVYAAPNCSSGSNYSRSESYDTHSRPSVESVTISGTSFIATTSYDATSGRVSSVTDPSGFVRNYVYNTQGYLSSLTNSGGTALWTKTTVDAWLNPITQTFANGIITNLGIDPGMGRLLTIQTGPSGSGTSVQNLTYAWDPAGNLSSRADTVNSVSETFTYDLDNRVLSSVIGGTTKWTSYDATGNISFKTGIGTYNYPSAGSALPHAVSSATGSVNGGVGAIATPSYSYDANGNMLYGGGRAFSYTAFNVPSCIESSATAITTCVAGSANTETFLYDSEHRRSQQISPEGTIIYINAGGVLTEKFTPTSGAVQWRSYLLAGGVNIGMYVRTVGGSPAPYTRYFHPDHLGSVSAITDDAGSSVEQDAYDPWGKRRNLNGSDDTGDTLGSLTNRGYTFQEHLADTALIHMNGRVYDPQIGKFTSGDPMVAQPYSSQGWNRYAYVGNNPMNSTDPSGMFWESVWHDVEGFSDSADADGFSDAGGGYNSNRQDGPIEYNTIFQDIVLEIYRDVFDTYADGNSVLTRTPLAYISLGNGAGLGGGGGGGLGGGANGGEGGGGNKGSDKKPQSKACSNGGWTDALPHGIGLSGGINGAIGVPGATGASGTASAGGGLFYSDNNGLSAGGYDSSAGGGSYFFGNGSQNPQGASPVAAGGSLSGGFSAFITNAQSAQQLSGPFSTITIEAGVGPIQGQLQISTGGGIWAVSVSPPFAGGTFGASISRVGTFTNGVSPGC